MEEGEIKVEIARLKAEYNVTDSALRQKITRKHTFEIEKFISWKVVGPKLPRMKQQDVKDIAIDVTGGQAMKRRELLNLWHQRNANGATYEAMIIAMLSEGLDEEATDVCKLLKPAAPLPPDPKLDGKPGPLGPPGTTLADSPGLAILVTCDYEGTDAALPGTNVDAEEMKKTFGFLHYVVHQLQNAGGNGCKAATKANIQALLSEVSGYLETYDATKTENKVIIFAFSGHGTSEDKKMKIIANDEGKLDVEDEIVLPLTRHKAVRKIPKLFFLDACRGSAKLRNKGDGDPSPTLVPKDFKLELTEKGVATSSGNYRIDYSTIPQHVSYADDRQGSMWMPVMARALRERNESVQNIAADVRGAVFQKLSALGESTTQCGETQGRLFGALKLVK